MQNQIKKKGGKGNAIKRRREWPNGEFNLRCFIPFSCLCLSAERLVRSRTLTHSRSWSWARFLFSARSTTQLGKKRHSQWHFSRSTEKKKENWLKNKSKKKKNRSAEGTSKSANQYQSFFFAPPHPEWYAIERVQIERVCMPIPVALAPSTLVLQRFWMQYNRPIVKRLCVPKVPLSFHLFHLFLIHFLSSFFFFFLSPFFWIFVFLFFANGRAGGLELTFKCHWCSSRPKDCCAGCAGGCWRPCPSRRSCQPCVPCWPAARLSLCAPFAGNEAILSSQFRPLIGWKTQSKELSETLSLIISWWLSLSSPVAHHREPGEKRIELKRH